MLQNIYRCVKYAYRKIIPKSIRKIIWWVKHYMMLFASYTCIYIPKMCTCICEIIIFILTKNTVRVSFINFWLNVNQTWFLSPLTSCLGGHDKPYRVVKYFKPDIQFFSVFGDIEKLVNSKIRYKIFFTGENVTETTIGDYCKPYKNNCVNHVSLSLGFDYMDSRNYLRFPLWLLSFFSPVDTRDAIQKKLDEFYACYGKTKFCALIASHDIGLGIRTKIFNSMSRISHVDCPGKLLHNDDTLFEKFDNNKLLYLRQYCFNICPENSVSTGYVTEKLFEALYSGCIPVYFGGGGGDPEPGVIDPGCFLWFEPDTDNTALLAEAQKLYTDKAYFESFKKRPIFCDTAVDKIYDMLQKYTVRIREIAYDTGKIKHL